ncbi:MAG: hypothetical protein AAGL10_11845 [Pseudomonadota bacterium]
MSCSAGEPSPVLGLVTSLPIYWPLGSGIEDFASGNVNLPWQRNVLSQCFTLQPIDTLSQPSGLDLQSPQVDPLSGISKLAIVQPRALTPEDNVALDDWVRAGGEVLIVLDPLLTGHYDLPLGDPRRPMDTSLFAIPPVVTRWGLEVVFDEPETFEDGVSEIALGGAAITVEVGSQWKVIDPNAATCDSFGNGYGVRCKVGQGYATLFGDAAVFEQRELAGQNYEAIAALIDIAFPR